MITAPFVHPDILTFLFAIISWIPTAMLCEKQAGTIVYMHRFLTYNLMVQVLFCLICLPLGLGMASYGLWPMVFVDMVIECMRSPDMQRQLCCFPVTLKSKYYPLVIVLLFSLFFGLQIPFFLGCAVGYLHAFGFLRRLELSANMANKIEHKGCIEPLSRRTEFVRCGGAMEQSILPSFVPRSTGPS